MSKSNAEAVKKSVEILSDRFEIWKKNDEAVMGLLDDAITRMTNSRKEIGAHAESLLKKSKQLDGIKEELLSVIQGEEGSASLDSFTDLDKDLKSLIGLARHFGLLERNLVNLKKMHNILAKTMVSELKPIDMKKAFVKFGQDLQYVWKYCELVCETYDETVIFNDKVFNKKVGLHEESE